MITATHDYIDSLTTALTQEHGITIKRGDQWQANVKKRELIYKETDLTRLAPEQAKGLILHEIGHLLHTEQGKPTELEKTVPYMHDVYNYFEDMRIERKLSEQYSDFADSALASVKELVTSSLQPITDDSPLSIVNQVLAYSTINHCAGYNRQRQFLSARTSEAFFGKLSKGAQAFLYENAHSYELTQAMQSAQFDETTDDLKKRIDTKVYRILKPLLDKIPQEQQRQAVENHAKAESNKGGFCPPDKSKFKTIPTDHELDMLLAPYIATLARHIGDILKERKATRISGLRVSGKLQNKNTYRVLTGETRIFSRYVKPQAPDYNVIISLDASGSMSGTKAVNTYIGAYLLKKVFERLHFTLTFVMFDNSARVITLPDYRHAIGGGNNDRKGLQICNKYLDPTKENLVLVLTDGQLCTPIDDLVMAIHKTPTLLLAVGIGMNSQELANAYKKAVNVPIVEKLPTALTEILKKWIHR